MTCTCKRCHFMFDALSIPLSCPDCGAPAVSRATPAEHARHLLDLRTCELPEAPSLSPGLAPACVSHLHTQKYA